MDRNETEPNWKETMVTALIVIAILFVPAFILAPTPPTVHPIHDTITIHDTTYRTA